MSEFQVDQIAELREKLAHREKELSIVYADLEAACKALEQFKKKEAFQSHFIEAQSFLRANGYGIHKKDDSGKVGIIEFILL